MMRRLMNIKRMEWFVAVTLILVGVIAFCIAGTVVGQSADAGAEVEAYYREQEQGMRDRTVCLLQEMGYRNSGVTLTRVVDREGNRSYTFTIHHGRIDKMTEVERKELAMRLAENTYFTGKQICDPTLDDSYSFCHEFLLYE